MKNRLKFVTETGNDRCFISTKEIPKEGGRERERERERGRDREKESNQIITKKEREEKLKLSMPDIIAVCAFEIEMEIYYWCVRV